MDLVGRLPCKSTKAALPWPLPFPTRGWAALLPHCIEPWHVFDIAHVLYLVALVRQRRGAATSEASAAPAGGDWNGPAAEPPPGKRTAAGWP